MYSRFAHHCGDGLGWLAAGISVKEIIEDYPDLTEQDIQACIEYAAERERRFIQYPVKHEAVV